MIKKIKPKYEDSFAEMYKPPFVPHERLLCKDMNKSYTKNLDEKKKFVKKGKKM